MNYREAFLRRVIPHVTPLPKFRFDEERKQCEVCLHVRFGAKPAMRCAKFKGAEASRANPRRMHYCVDARTMLNMCGPEGRYFVEVNT